MVKLKSEMQALPIDEALLLLVVLYFKTFRAAGTHGSRSRREGRCYKKLFLNRGSYFR